MSIEDEIFKKSIILYDKLNPYGFKKEGEKYILTQNILDNSFRVDIEINNSGIVNGSIYDLDFNEEYTNFRVSGLTGEFVNKVRAEFINILEDIRRNCTKTNFFSKSQSNRITNFILEKYNNTPAFLWEKFPDYGVFKNPNNDKWYACIMNISKSKIDSGDEEVEVLNIKLDEQEIVELLKKKGFYPAYHMNKQNWITILLDDTVEDEEIISYIEKSHRFTEKNEEWIIPANPKYYDIIHCFKDTNTILWKQSNHINIGDIVYMYVAAPYSCILYKCEVIEANIPYEYKDKNLSMEKVMKIKLIKEMDKNKYTFEVLNQYGIKAIRGPRSMPKELIKEIDLNEQ